jgi:hypothetical protein
LEKLKEKKGDIMQKRTVKIIVVAVIIIMLIFAIIGILTF